MVPYSLWTTTPTKTKKNITTYLLINSALINLRLPHKQRTHGADKTDKEQGEAAVLDAVYQTGHGLVVPLLERSTQLTEETSNIFSFVGVEQRDHNNLKIINVISLRVTNKPELKLKVKV